MTCNSIPRIEQGGISKNRSQTELARIDDVEKQLTPTTADGHKGPVTSQEVLILLFLDSRSGILAAGLAVFRGLSPVASPHSV